MEISHQQLDEILADFSALGRATYLDDPALGFGHTATDRDEHGIPLFSSELPQIPVALIERHQALMTHPDTDGPQQEVWTTQAAALGMHRIGTGVFQLPNLDGWLIAEWPDDQGGLQLQQPNGSLFVYALCPLEPAWLAAARHYDRVLVLHGPNLGLTAAPDRATDPAAELLAAREQGLVTGGLMQWGRVRTP